MCCLVRLFGLMTLGIAITVLPVVAQVPRPTDSPGTNSTDAKSVEDELAKLDAAIAAKETELAAMRDKAKILRERLGKDKGVIALQKLIDGMPKASMPVSGVDGEIERNRANKWLKENAVGKRVEIIESLTEVAIKPQGEVYDIALVFGGPTLTDAVPNTPIFCFMSKVKVGNEEWFTLAKTVVEKGVTEDRAKKFRDLKGARVRIQAKIESVKFSHESVTSFGSTELLSVMIISFANVEADLADAPKK